MRIDFYNFTEFKIALLNACHDRPEVNDLLRCKHEFIVAECEIRFQSDPADTRIMRGGFRCRHCCVPAEGIEVELTGQDIVDMGRAVMSAMASRTSLSGILFIESYETVPAPINNFLCAVVKMNLVNYRPKKKEWMFERQYYGTLISGGNK